MKLNHLVVEVSLKQQDVMAKFELLFNEFKHKYIDTYGNNYTSMTTVIGKYEPVFERVKIAKAVTRKRDSKYYGWNYINVLNDWDTITKISQDKGNKTHNRLERITKPSTNFTFDSTCDVKNYKKLYTVDSIINGTNYGELDVDKFLDTGIKEKYPRIYNLFIYLSNLGYSFYSEIAVYNISYLISGLIDILAVNHNTKEFIIVDWKTNKHDLVPNGIEANKFLSGYFKKDKQGKETTEFVYTHKHFNYPLDKYEASHYLIYTLQLNGYANLFIDKGFKLNQLILCHVRDDKFFTEDDAVVKNKPEYLGLIKTDLHDMPIMQEDVTNMFTHFSNGMSDQTSLF